MEDFGPWGASGQIPLEDALRLEVPAQRCYLYRLDVGGDTYVGMTTLDPETALANHIEQARRGDSSKLHKTLRRFAYVCSLATLSEHADEIDCLVAKVSQVRRLSPTLNSTFGGEGSQFNLIELPNELGEQILFVENKRVRHCLLRTKRRTNPAHLNSLVRRIRQRYDKLEERLPQERARFAEELWSVPLPPSERYDFPPASDDVVSGAVRRVEVRPSLRSLAFSRAARDSKIVWLSSEDVVAYASQRATRYARLRDWLPETARTVEDHLRLSKFVTVHNIKLLTNGKSGLTAGHAIGGVKVAYEHTTFNSDTFANANRVFLFNDDSLTRSQIFSDEHSAKDWLARQSWYLIAVRDGVVRLGDAFYPFRIDAGRYGGVLGMFTKANYRVSHVLVDERILRG